jgi:hypothetical protein
MQLVQAAAAAAGHPVVCLMHLLPQRLQLLAAVLAQQGVAHGCVPAAAPQTVLACLPFWLAVHHLLLWV